VTKTYNIAILIHGVSLSLRGSGRLDTRLDTPPISLRHHPGSGLARAYLGLGNIFGSVGTAGASADVNTALATIGGRYGFSTLEAGPYVAARANVGWVDYQSKRALGGGLGTTQGNTKGAVYGGGADIGDVRRDNQDGNPATIRMRMRRCRGDEGRA
jgi:hypothetical protein